MVFQSSAAKALSMAAVVSAAATPSALYARTNTTCLDIAKANGTATAECLNWRPNIHVQPPQGWMNDPCAPGYDTANKKYHLGMQWTPDGIAWNNITWGAAVSDDLINWKISRKTSIEPSAPYDYLGVFTGGAFDGNINGEVNGTITTAYTAVDALPISWKNNYTRGSESVALAFSDDSGLSWTRYEGNVIVEDGPTDVDIVGWRDPYIAQWPSVEAKLHNNVTGNYLYAIVSGGIRDTTPTTWLYEIDANALQNWRYVGPLVDIEMQYDPSPKWIGGYGANFEVCNFATISSNDGTVTRDYILCGCEGKNVTTEVAAAQGSFRSDKGQTWFQGDWTVKSDSVQMGYKHGGRLDYGDIYAANGFWDPVTSSHVVWGWVAEDDLPTRFLEAQFWAGSLSLPRTQYIWTVDNVKGALQSELSDIASVELVAAADGTNRATGFAGVADTRIEGMRRKHTTIKQSKAGGLRKKTTLCSPHESLELKIKATVGPTSSPIGVRLLHGNDETTLIQFSAADEQITIDRSNSTWWPDIRTIEEIAPHTLFQFNDDTWESLEFDIFYDRSIIEVFANGRTAVTSRVYPTSGHVEGIELVYASNDTASSFVSGELWKLQTSLTYIE
uniref:Beta-fructofuranosidase n=1 Tax=Huntiella moniliformis TaxID=1580861 RepID=T2C607_9PEZI|nr:beta-fructofuranosidase [Huntiella moniliformis]